MYSLDNHDTALSAENLGHHYGNFEALKPVDFRLRAGEIVVLSGPNGSGKTTLLLCLSGLLRPTSGRVCVDGSDLYEDEPSARRGLAYVPDVPSFYQEMTAWEHVQFICLAHKATDGFEKRARALFEAFGLWDARNLYPHAYSRGMRLKLGLSLALVRPFSVLLLDEPSAALDAESTAQLAERLRAARDQGAAVLLSTHDPRFMDDLSSSTWSMRAGVLDAR